MPSSDKHYLGDPVEQHVKLPLTTQTSHMEYQFETSCSASDTGAY